MCGYMELIKRTPSVYSFEIEFALALDGTPGRHIYSINVPMLKFGGELIFHLNHFKHSYIL